MFIHKVVTPEQVEVDGAAVTQVDSDSGAAHEVVLTPELFQQREQLSLLVVQYLDEKRSETIAVPLLLLLELMINSWQFVLTIKPAVSSPAHRRSGR